MKKICTFIVSIILVFSLTACGKVELPEKILDNTLVLNEDGSLDFYLTDSFDKDYYDVNELSTMAENEVDDFLSNSGNEKGAVKVETANLVVNSGTNVSVKYNFSNAGVYSEFFGENLFYGTVADAVKNNEGLNSNFIDIKKGSSVTKDELLKNVDRHIIITDSKAYIYCPSKVIYVSDNATYKDGYVDCLESEGTVIIVMK